MNNQSENDKADLLNQADQPNLEPVGASASGKGDQKGAQDDHATDKKGLNSGYTEKETKSASGLDANKTSALPLAASSDGASQNQMVQSASHPSVTDKH